MAAVAWSGVTLAGDASALARVTVQPLGGTIEHIEAFGPGGQRLPISIDHGRLTPREQLTPGERISVDVEVRRPGWLGWALGSHESEQLTLSAPVAHVTKPWMTVQAGSEVHVSFDQPVSAVAYGSSGDLTAHALSVAQRSISLGTQPETGATEVAAAVRPWETVGVPTPVSWFPPSRAPVMDTLPAAGTRIAPSRPIYLTFSEPVSEVLGSGGPRLSPATSGHWREPNSHTLIFTPSGFGAALGSQLRIQLPRPVAVTGGAGGGLRTSSQVEWTVPPGSTLRLQQLLAQAGYLPVDWRPAGAPVARTPAQRRRRQSTRPTAASAGATQTRRTSYRALWSPGRRTWSRRAP